MPKALIESDEFDADDSGVPVPSHVALLPVDFDEFLSMIDCQIQIELDLLRAHEIHAVTRES